MDVIVLEVVFFSWHTLNFHADGHVSKEGLSNVGFSVDSQKALSSDVPLSVKQVSGHGVVTFPDYLVS